MKRTARAAFFVVATLASGGVAFAQTGGIGPPSASPVPPGPGSSPAAPATAAPKPAGQGIAVVGLGAVKDDAFALARAIYGSRLRPTALDEVRARVLAGAPPPANASRELRELAEVRASVTGDDAAGRRLLAGIGQQIGVEALLVVRMESREADRPDADAGPPEQDAGAEGGSEPAAPARPEAPPSQSVSARLFLVEPGEFDAARYVPESGMEGPAAWKSTVTSLERRFPPTARAALPAVTAKPASFRPEEEKSRPFYASGWFWGAIGAAAILGAAFYFGSQDSSTDPIHLQMRVPK